MRPTSPSSELRPSRERLAGRTEAVSESWQPPEDWNDWDDDRRWRHLFHRLTALQQDLDSGLAEVAGSQGGVSVVLLTVTGGIEQIGALMGSQTITADQGTTLSVEETDDQGNPVPFSGQVAPWTADDGGQFVSLQPSADGTKVNVSAVGPVGSANVSTTLSGVTDDAGNPVVDPTTGQPLQIAVTEAVTVVPGPVSAAQVTASDPWAKSAPPTV